jgi:plasmid maintenance system antidote protein VapI
MNYNLRIEQSGLKKVWLAKQLGVSKVTFSYYINGTRNFPEDMKRKLNEILDTYTQKHSDDGEIKIG